MKEVIDRVISDFDFEKVHRVMLASDWWWDSTYREQPNKPFGVPSINDLITCARRLLQDVSKMDVGDSISIGGFRATKINNEDEYMGEGFKLEFILENGVWYTKWLDDE